MNLYEPRVRVIAPGAHFDPLAQSYTIVPFRRVEGGTQVLEYGPPKPVNHVDGATVKVEGIDLPAEFAVPLWHALGEAIGKVTDEDVRIIREWMEYERGRVDTFLGHHLLLGRDGEDT